MLILSIDTLIGISDVEKEVFLVVFLVQTAHGGGGRRDHVVHEEKQGVFGAQTEKKTNQINQ